MGNFDKAEICQALALLGSESEPFELIGNDGDSGNTGLFKITLVNYQPWGAAASVALGRDHQIGLHGSHGLGDAFRL